VEEDLEISATTDACAILEMEGPVTVTYGSSIRRLMDHAGYVCAARISGSEGEMVLEDGGITLQTRSGYAADEKPRSIDPQAPEVGTWQAFARAIEAREPTLTASADNLRSLELLFAAIESAESGRVVSLGS
jgi:predicted dehydrogenase